MRLLNKIAVGASAFAFAAALTAGVVASPAPVAKAEDQSPTPATVATNVSIDLEKQQLLITGDEADQQISVSFPTVKKGSTEITGEKNVCTYDVAGGKVTADLSTLNPTKDNYVKVWGNKNDKPIIIKIPAAETLDKAKVKFDTNGKATATVCKKGSSTAYTDARVDFAVGTGNWEPSPSDSPAVFDADKYTALGATVRARIAGSVKKENSFATTIALSSDTTTYASKQYSLKKDSTTKYTAYELKGSFPSKEIKIKVPKKAAAPKVKVDYKLGTLKLPKNAEYRVNTVDQNSKALTLGGSKGADKWTAGDKKTFTTIATEGSEFNIKKAGSIDVRIKATEKKPASMYLAFRYNAQAVLNVVKPNGEKDLSDTEGKNKPGDAICNSTKAEVGLKVNEQFKADLTAAYTRTAATYKNNDGKTVKTATSGAITLTDANKTYTYDCVLMKSSEVPKADTKKGVKSVKNGKDVTIKVKNDDEYTLFARRAAVKGGTDWATEWLPVITFTKSDLAPTVKVTQGAGA